MSRTAHTAVTTIRRPRFADTRAAAQREARAIVRDEISGTLQLRGARQRHNPTAPLVIGPNGSVELRAN